MSVANTETRDERMSPKQPLPPHQRPSSTLRKHRYLSLASLLLAGSVFACSSAEASVQDVSEVSTAPPSREASGPPLDLQAPSTPELSGEVVQVLDAGSYTYFRLHSGEQERWIVVMGAGPELGARVDVSVMGEREGFYSPRLDREFEFLSFARIDSHHGGPT